MAGSEEELKSLLMKVKEESVTDSLSRVRPISLALSLSLSPRSPMHSSTVFSSSLGFSCYLLNKMEL